MANLSFCIPIGPISWLGFAFNGPVTVLCVLFGVCGNLYWLKFLFGQLSSSRWATFLASLAVWDCVLLLSTLGFYAIAVLCLGAKPWNGSFAYIYLTCYPLVNMAMTASLWTVVAISVERYLALAQPLLWHVNGSCAVRKLVILIAVGSFGVNLPTLLELKLVECIDRQNNDVLPQIATTALRNDSLYLLLYRVVFYSIFFTPAPFILVLILTIRTQHIRRKALYSGSVGRNCQAQRRNSPAITERHTAALLNVVVFKFLVCYLLPTIVNLIELFDSINTHSRLFVFLVDINNLLVIIQSSSNWLVYSRWRHQPATYSTIETEPESLLNANEMRCVVKLWCSIDKHQFGRQLIETLVRRNPSLQMHFMHESAAPAVAQGRNIGHFFDQTLMNLLEGKVRLACSDLRRVGERHQSAGVRLQTADWLLIKQFVCHQLMSAKSSPDTGECVAVSKFVSFMIGELRTGALKNVDKRPHNAAGRSVSLSQYDKPTREKYRTRFVSATTTDFERKISAV